jgi:hypothetical protein
MFLVATAIDFGITVDSEGTILSGQEKEKIRQQLLNMQDGNWRSHYRLRRIAELLRDHKRETRSLVQKQYCPVDCRQSGCPLEEFIAENLGWRA